MNHIIYSNFKKTYGSTLLELSYNSADKSSILKIDSIDILASIKNKAVSNDVYNTVYID